MSFSLLGAEDDRAVLEEALAFIDSCGTEEDDTTDSSASGHVPADGKLVGDDSSAKDTRRSDTPPAKPKAKKRRIKTFASSSTRQLQRKKAEATSLREEALVLEAQIDLLKHAKQSSPTGPQTASTRSARESKGYDQAVTQAVLRQQAEKVNRDLKAILANQEQVSESLRSVLQRRSALQGMDVVFGGSAPLYRPPQPLDRSMGIMHLLEQRVENLYLDSQGGFGWDMPWLVTSKMNVNSNTQYGKVIEIETITPVACSIQEAAAILWKDMKTIHEIPDKRYRYLRGSKPHSLEKNFVMRLRGQDCDIEINGSHFSRKFEEDQRIVVAKADSMILPTQGLEFKSPSWTTITASESDPQHASVVRSYLRIYAEVQNNLDARAEDLEFARNFVLNGLSKMMFGCAQKTQSELVQQMVVI
ncbi:uncharacterized protein IUM83_10823 [Phytophthora cinnamomi]|uniref:uncharacterized protein n=1 Tax=Phytophthora cinnamomi TaxID=4785 RepID=UPI0035597D7F|nr:hypothetical protein IUM83_10823 [Phytophthora cinnamomi]